MGNFFTPTDNSANTFSQLVLICHGTSDLEGKAAYRYLADQLQTRIDRCDLQIHQSNHRKKPIRVNLCFLDHDQPLFIELISEPHTVFIPLFLTHGHHVEVDIFYAAREQLHPTSTLTAPIGDKTSFFIELFHYYISPYLTYNSCTQDRGIVEEEKPSTFPNTDNAPLVIAVAGSRSAKAIAEYESLRYKIEQAYGCPTLLWCANTQKYYRSLAVKIPGKDKDDIYNPLHYPLSPDSFNQPFLVLAYLLIPGYFYTHASTIASTITPPLVYIEKLTHYIVQLFAYPYTLSD